MQICKNNFIFKQFILTLVFIGSTSFIYAAKNSISADKREAVVREIAGAIDDNFF